MKTVVIYFDDDETEKFENIIAQMHLKKDGPDNALGQNLDGLKHSNHFYSLAIDFAMRSVFIDGTQIHLTPLEYKLLCFLLKNKGHVFSKQQLLKNVWEYDDGTCKVVSNTISNLRSKIETDSKNPVYIKTVHGGYMFSNSYGIESAISI